jgi:hypothetical protein
LNQQPQDLNSDTLLPIELGRLASFENGLNGLMVKVLASLTYQEFEPYSDHDHVYL